MGWRNQNLFLFLINTLLLYPSLSPYSQTDRRTAGQTESQIHSLRMGWRNQNLFLFLINTLLLYPSLSPYSQTDRRTDGQTESQIHSLRVGLRNLISSCAVCCVSFWFWREKGFGSNMHVLLRVEKKSSSRPSEVVLLCQFLVLAGK